MRPQTLTALAILLAVLAGCNAVPVPYTLKPTGDNITVTLNNGTSITGEFIADDPSAVYVLSHDYLPKSNPPVTPHDIVCIPYQSMKKMIVLGYNDHNWIIPVTIFQIIPAIMMGIAAERNLSGTGLCWTGVYLIPGLVTGLLFELSTPPTPKAEAPFPEEQRAALRKYARYPQGLPPGIIDALLLEYNKREMLTIR